MNGKVVALVIIVIVVSSLSGIVLYQSLTGSNSGSSQAETLELENQHVWYNQTGWSEAAIVVVNTGQKDALLRKITVKGVECNWNTVYYWKIDTGPISSELKQTPNELSGSSVSILVDGIQRAFLQSVSELTLMSGRTVVLYVKNPGNITLNDVNKNVTISIFSGIKLYYEEAIVEANFVSQVGVMLAQENVSWPTASTITVAIKNTGTSNAKITGVYLGTSSTNLNLSVSMVPTSATINAGSRSTFTITYAWTANTRYYFKFATDTAVSLEFSEKSP